MQIFNDFSQILVLKHNLVICFKAKGNVFKELVSVYIFY